MDPADRQNQASILFEANKQWKYLKEDVVYFLGVGDPYRGHFKE